MNNNYYYVDEELFEKDKNSCILEKTKKIINERKSSYGENHIENLNNIATIASILSKKDLVAQDICNVLISLKLVRESASHKEDNLIDLISYIKFLNDVNAHGKK